ncbi:MAG: UxaA family hydrolase [Vicinamibacterales bacterium]
MKPALVISERDNVATALETLEAGRTVVLGSIAVTVSERIPHGHKMALTPIAAGQPVMKYGSAIGLATCDIAAGAHVHVHNLASSRGRGDLEGALPEPRLAEPSDASAPVESEAAISTPPAAAVGAAGPVSRA